MYAHRALFSRLFLYEMLQRYWHFNFSKWPPATVVDLAQSEVAPSDLENPTQEPNMNGPDDALQSYGHLKFSKMWGRSVVSRWSVVNIHTSDTDVIYSS